MKEQQLAHLLLNAVWEEDVAMAKRVLLQGGDPSWRFNGYPILVHAVYTRNIEMVTLLVNHGALQIDEALGFALEHSIGEVIIPLALEGAVPKVSENELFGPYPSRYAPMGMRV